MKGVFMKINLKYIVAFSILLIIEIMIAIFVNDDIIRPYIGDVLVIILMYTFIRGIIEKSIKHLPLYLLVFAASVELSQYYHLVNLLHLQNNKVLSTIIGNSFDAKDILCYLIGAVALVVWEKIEKNTSVLMKQL
jgi:hypothetical protein